MLGNHTPLHFFGARTVNSHRYKVEAIGNVCVVVPCAVVADFVYVLLFMEDNVKPHIVHIIDDFLDVENIQRMNCLQDLWTSILFNMFVMIYPFNARKPQKFNSDRHH